MSKERGTNVATLPVPPVLTGSTSYVTEFSSYIPKTLHRVLSSPEDVVRAAHEGMSLHEISLSEATSKAHLPNEKVLDVVNHGRGTISDVIDVLAAVGIDAVSVPSPASLAKGV